MTWDVEYTAEFEQWWLGLGSAERESVAAHVGMLEEIGPRLGAPYTTSVTTSRHSHMRELRVQHRGRPYRVLYAFDPRRVALLLIGGEKTGDDRWYERFVPIADRLYDEHLRTIKREGL